MKLKLVLFTLLAGVSAFAESRFSISIGGIGGYAPRYYAPPPVHYVPARPQRLYRRYERFDRGWSGSGYWGESPQRQHERAERYGMHKHQQGERFMYGDSEELRDHQAQEQWQLRREQRHERNGDLDAADGPAHGSARDGFHYHGH